MNGTRAKNYRKYLESSEWAKKRADAIARANNRCQLCNVAAPSLQAHHRTYERVGRELPGDLTVLCGPCHRRHHASRVEPKDRAGRRREIEQEILTIVGESGLISWRDIQRQIKAPRAQAWSRAQMLVKTGQISWKYGKLCLHSSQDLIGG